VEVLTLVHESPVMLDASLVEAVVRSSSKIGIYYEWNLARLRARFDLPIEKIIMTPPTVSNLASAVTSAEQRRVARAAIGVSEDALVVLSIGYLSLTKGCDLFAQVAARCVAALPPEMVRRLVFIWVGDDASWDAQSAFRHDVEAFGLGDIVRRREPQVDLTPWYRAADLLVSTSRYEAFGLTILQAKSAGLPVVAFSESGAAVQLVVEPSDVVPPLDIHRFSERVLLYLRDAALRARIGQAGHERVRREFSDGKLAPALQAIFDALA
jgi:glycosyltransferase involved in cell wall biosynthesis